MTSSPHTVPCQEPTQRPYACTMCPRAREGFIVWKYEQRSQGFCLLLLYFHIVHSYMDLWTSLFSFNYLALKIDSDFTRFLQRKCS